MSVKIAVEIMRGQRRLDAVVSAESPAIISEHVSSKQKRLMSRLRDCSSLIERLWLCDWP